VSRNVDAESRSNQLERTGLWILVVEMILCPEAVEGRWFYQVEPAGESRGEGGRMSSGGQSELSVTEVTVKYTMKNNVLRRAEVLWTVT
jgi:hypothetical protein